MTKIIKEMLPPDVRVARDAQDLLIECCVGKIIYCYEIFTCFTCVIHEFLGFLLWFLNIFAEFINLVSSESNDVCNKEDKRTIAPEHVLKALQVLGFGEYIEEVYAAYEQHKYETMVIILYFLLLLLI